MCKMVLFVFATLPALAADARFASIKGNVQIYQNQRWVDANLKTVLPSGTMIQTGLASQAVVIYPKGGQLALAPNTKVTILDQTQAQGTNREIMIDHGHVSAFVKKSTDGSRNEFRMRTPTVVAGVRGSVIAGMLVGQKLTVQAIQSAAQIARASQNRNISSAEVSLANARKSVATAQDYLQRAKDYIQQLKTELEAASASESYSKVSRLQQQLASTERSMEIYAADVAKYSKLEKDAVQKLADKKAGLSAIAEEERALIKIAQGDVAKGTGPEITAPTVVQKETTRPAQMTTVGQSGSEKTFSSKSDVKVGVGNDFQKVFNSVNTVTQPTTTGLPTLKKL